MQLEESNSRYRSVTEPLAVVHDAAHRIQCCLSLRHGAIVLPRGFVTGHTRICCEANEHYMYAAKLASSTSSRAICQAFASGLGGYLGHVYDRSVVTAVGCFIWGTTTLLFSFTTSVGWGAFTWAWNGVGLSFIIPNSQSLVADYYSDTDRGKAFGTLYTTGSDLMNFR